MCLVALFYVVPLLVFHLDCNVLNSQNSYFGHLEEKLFTAIQKGGCLQTFANVIWILCGGIWIAVSHLFFGLLLCITIIGLPFGRKHFKMIELSLMPFGKKIVNA